MLAEAYYRQLLDLSQRLLSAGMAQHWDVLLRLDQERRALLDSPPRIAPGESTRPLIESIRQVQACDAQLLEKVETWMAGARILLRLDTRRAPEA